MTMTPPERTIPAAHRRARRTQRAVLAAVLLASDALMVGLALLLAWYLRIGGGWLVYNAPADYPVYRQVAWLSALIFVLIFAALGLYNPDGLLGGTQEYARILRGCTYGVIALIVVSFLQHDRPLSRGWLILSWLLLILLVGVSRFAWRRVFHWARRKWGWFISPTLIVGVSDHALAIAAQLNRAASSYKIVGFVDEFMPPGTPVLDDLAVLGNTRQLHELTAAHQVEQVILLSNAVTWESFQEVMAGAGFANGYQLRLSPGFYEILTANVQVTHQAFVPLLHVDQARLSGLDWVFKTLLDFGLGALLLVCSLPLGLLIALAILLSDGRPLFTRHKVLGIKGLPFWTIKFRTDLWGSTRRRLDCDPAAEIVDDPQIASRVGRFLYRSGLDKLPQLLDVLRGHMSLVGPRSNLTERELHSRTWHPSLLTVKPGWTGPWAVGGATTLEDEMRLNLFYIRNWTIWLDLQILYQTLKLALSRRSRPAK